MARPMLLLVAICVSAVLIQPTTQKTVSQTITFAPEADVINDIDDVSAETCALEIASFCSSLTPGEGVVADCLSGHMTESDINHPETTVSEACREEVLQYYIKRNLNINSNLAMAKVCEVDAVKYCNVTWFFGYRAGQVISCLRDVKDRLEPDCREQIFKTQQQAAWDMRADVSLYDACKDDISKLCKDVKYGGGRVQSCLRDQRDRVVWTCDNQLFRQEVENADDIRLNVRMFSKCVSDMNEFCEGVAPGGARVTECLLEHRTDEGFSSGCRQDVDAMIAARLRNFRLDSHLRKDCEDDIFISCAYFGDSDPVGTMDKSVKCLMGGVDSLRSDACRQRVHMYMELLASDIGFNWALAQACFTERQELCGDVPPGRVMRCLSNERAQLSRPCRATLFESELMFSKNVDFQAPMKAACGHELELFCKDVPHGEARAIRCLQESTKSRDFGESCRREVALYEQEALTDYRLNFRLSVACKADISALCKEACDTDDGVCNGKVLRCLSDNKAQIKSEACQEEVTFSEHTALSDLDHDAIVSTACAADIQKYCSSTGGASVHDCLREHGDDLSTACRDEEALLAETETVVLSSGVLRACSEERGTYCKGVQSGHTHLFRCLADKMGDAAFGETCRIEITNQLRRKSVLIASL